MNKWSDKGDDTFEPFNMSDFKKWMSQQHDANKSNMVGLAVESKIPLKRLVSRIEVQEGETLEVAKNFKKHGGTITEENGHYMYVNTNGGSFMIHRMHIKRADD